MSIRTFFSYLYYELVRIIIGMALGVALTLYILTRVLYSKEKDTIAPEAEVKAEKVELQAANPSSEDMEMLKEALKLIKDSEERAVTTDTRFTIVEKKINKLRMHLQTIVDNNDLVQLELMFNEIGKNTKERIKQTKALLAYVTDIGRVYTSLTKDLSKLSQTAKVSNSAMNKTRGNSDDGTADPNALLERPSEDDKMLYSELDQFRSIWISFCESFEYLSQDQDSLGENINIKIVDAVKIIYEGQLIHEKKVTAEGAKLITSLKDALSTYDTRIKERDRTKEKLADNLNQSLGSTEGKSTIFGDNIAKMKLKAETAEQALISQKEKLESARKDYISILPKVIIDFEQSSITSYLEIKTLLLSLVDLLSATSSKNITVLQTMKQKINNKIMVGFEDSLSELYSNIQDTSAENIARNNVSCLEMKSISAAILAACPPSMLPPLPSSFQHSIGIETSIWFNAFTGRVYRDIGESAYFHNWLCQKATLMLNKGKRPEFIDQFTVEQVKFGTIPPVLSNIQWVPMTSQPDEAEANYDVECTGDIVFKSGISFKICTKLFVNWPREKYASIPVLLQLDVIEVAGRIRFGVNKKNSFLSFLDEPHSRFHVHSEVGELFKFQDLPKLSQFVIKKIKKFINSRLVHPNRHKFRLVWPRSWWPPGAENEFLPTTVPSEATSIDSKVDVSVNVQKEPSAHTASPATPTKGTMIRSKLKSWFDKNSTNFKFHKNKESLNSTSFDDDEEGINSNKSRRRSLSWPPNKYILNNTMDRHFDIAPRKIEIEHSPPITTQSSERQSDATKEKGKQSRVSILASLKKTSLYTRFVSTTQQPQQQQQQNQASDIAAEIKEE